MFSYATLDEAHDETLESSDSLTRMITLQQQMDGREEILANTVRLHELLQPQISNMTDNATALEELRKRWVAARYALESFAFEMAKVKRSGEDYWDLTSKDELLKDCRAQSDTALHAVRDWSEAVLRLEAAIEPEESAKQSAGGASAETTGN